MTNSIDNVAKEVLGMNEEINNKYKNLWWNGQLEIMK